MSLVNGFDLKMDSSSEFSLLSSPGNPFYSTSVLNSPYSSSPKLNFEKFYNDFSHKYESEKERIGNLYNFKIIDEKSYQIMTYFSKEVYFSSLLSFIQKEGKLPPQLLKKYSSISDSALTLLRENNLFLDIRLYSILFSALRIKMQEQKGDFLNVSELFKKAENMHLGKYKPNLLFAFLNYQGSDEYRQNILNSLIRDYRNTAFSEEAEATLKKYNEIADMEIKDTLIDVLGGKISWDSFTRTRNIYLVVDFWASWCKPCRALFPVLDSIKKFYSDKKNVRFVSVNIDKEKNDWLIASKAESQYLKGGNYFLNMGREGNVTKKYEINSIPRIMVIKDQKVVSKNFSLPTDPRFKSYLDNLIRE